MRKRALRRPATNTKQPASAVTRKISAKGVGGNLTKYSAEGSANAFTWKTHTWIRYPDRVAHHCTGCHRDRFLRLWWKEKPEVSEESGPDRYMCNHCFANDWPRVVPETYTGRLASMFTSPELPLTRAQLAELGKEKETESNKPQK